MSTFASFWDYDGKIYPGGESKDKKHPGWFDVYSMDLGLGRRDGRGHSGRGSKRTVPDKSITLELRQTPAITMHVKNVASSANIPLVRIDVTEDGKTAIMYELTNVRFTSLGLAGPEEGSKSRPSTLFLSGIYWESKLTYKHPAKGKVTVVDREPAKHH